MEIKRLGDKDQSIAENILKNLTENSNNPGTPSAFHLNELLKNKTCYLVAAIEDNSAVGFVLAYRFPSFYANENTAYLYDIEVLPAYRRKGVAGRLIKYLAEHLKSDGVNEVWLGTGVDNLAAQKLFSSTGAQKEEETFCEYFYYLK